MTIQRIQEAYNKRPFAPFSIHLADGSAVEVKHPEFLALNPNGRVIVVIGEDESVSTIDLLLVTKLVEHPLEANSSRS